MNSLLYTSKTNQMDRYLLLFFTLLFSVQIHSQTQVERVEVTGKVVVSDNDVEGVTVYNTSSNKGTITDENGTFTIMVALNDVIEFAALQFKDFSLTIDEHIIKSRKMTVFLVEQVNRLDEVVILPYDLSGNLTVDIESVRTFNPDLDAIYFGVAHPEDFEFSDDIRSKVDNPAMDSQTQHQRIRYGLNVVNLVGVLVKPLFKRKSKKDEEKEVPDIPVKSFKDKYSAEFLNQNFNIPKERVDDFVSFVEDNGLDYTLLERGRELEFLEFINVQSKLFLKTTNDKD